MPSPGRRPADPYRVLGVAPDATFAEVKRAYRTLAKRHHPDAAGPADTERFLAIQQAYESIATGRGRVPRGTPATRGERGEASGDWYAEARDAARGRARQGRGDARRPRSGGPGGSNPGARGASGGRGAAGAGAAPGGARGADETATGDGDRVPRTATIGSTTYDDAVTGEPPWDGAAWYGAASGTYWTVNPREYADPRKHGPEYLARALAAARETAMRETPARARGAAARDDGRHGPAAGSVDDPASDDAPGDRPGRRASSGAAPASAGAGVVGRLRRKLRPTRPDPRVG